MERPELGTRVRRPGEEMKGNAFGDRARQLTEWFQAWNSCEQTIALYSLLSKVSAIQARFLSLVLEHSLKNGCDSQELTRLERQANNAAFLSSLHIQTEDTALSQLLTHLPLLHPGNTEARKEYMKLLPKVLLGSSEVQDYLDQCRQLLSLALVHPAFPHDDREALTFWLKKLDEKHFTVATKKVPSQPAPHTTPVSSPSASSLPHKRKIYQVKTEESSSSLGNGAIMEIDGYINGYDTPEEPSSCDAPPPPPPPAASSMPLLEDMDKRGSLPPNHSIYEAFQSGSLSRANTLPTSRTLQAAAASEDIPSLEWQTGMKDVPLWLKSLRLHKYAVLFAPLTYEEMLDMQEDYLEKNNVTQGARKKIILSIRRLARRPETLLEIEQDLEKYGKLLPCINELRQMLQTPLKPYRKEEGRKEGGKEGQKERGKERGERRREGMGAEEKREKEGKGDGALSGDEDGQNDDSSDSGSGSPGQHSSSDGGSDLEELLTKDFPTEDLPSLLSRAMGKAYSQLMLHTDTNEDNLSAFIKLLDSALLHEAFTLEHKKLFFEWKQQCQQTLRVITPKKNSRGRNWGAFTIAGMPSQSSRGSKSRSLRHVKNGGMMKGIGLPTASRNSSTLPRMSPRALGPQSFPTHHFPRPSSTVYPSSSPSQMNAHSKPFVPSPQPPSYCNLPPSSSSSLPHKPCDEASFANLARGVANYILDDTSDS